jgi:hypothetical protein
MARHQEMADPSRAEREKEAIAASQKRVKQFALDFSATVERAMALFSANARVEVARVFGSME